MWKISKRPQEITFLTSRAGDTGKGANSAFASGVSLFLAVGGVSALIQYLALVDVGEDPKCYRF